MSEWMQLAQSLGPVGIIALALFFMARAIAPAISELATARREANDIAKRNNDRWQQSDLTVAGITAEFKSAAQKLGTLADNQSEQNVIQKQWIEKIGQMHDSQIDLSQTLTEYGRAVAVDRSTLALQVGDKMTDSFKERDAQLQVLHEENVENGRKLDALLAKLEIPWPPVEAATSAPTLMEEALPPEPKPAEPPAPEPNAPQ